MCGISGFFGDHRALSSAVLDRMNRTLARRGPDDHGAFCEPGVGLAMRRLSIIDLAGGHQPIQNEDGSIYVVFNGEIYNYLELRRDLSQRGHQFRTHSDTEVIVHLYEEYGEELVQHLRGMFAFALWDRNRRRGLVARDRLGIKPLFYAEVGGSLLFGSEAKAVLASGLVERELDPQGFDAFFTYTYIPAPHTIYRHVRKLEPGHLLTYQVGRVKKRRYWEVDFAKADDDATEREWLERFDRAIRDAVCSHLISDVPVGAFLSGGIDSSLVVALMSEHVDQPVQTFTMGFGGARNALLDERPLARMVAGRYGCRFHEYSVQPDLREIVGEIVQAFDEPFADDSVVPSYYISRLTRQSVKVALSGLGGDELFAGYERYTGVLLGQYYSRFVPSTLHRLVISPVVRRLPESSHGGDRVDHIKRFAAAALRSPAERYLDFVSTLKSDERIQLFAPDVARNIDFQATDRLVTEPYERCGAPDDVSRALYVDLKTYLPEDILALSDRLSMWHSLELRVPFVDHVLVELAARLPVRYKLDWRQKKILLKRLAARRLPDAVLEHRKQGFEAPMASWLRSDLLKYAQDVLGKGRLGATGLFNHEFVTARLQDHLSGRRKNNKLLFSLIMFQEWHERYAH
jgi:asparagine synthase (glutamine-hydrolysing)